MANRRVHWDWVGVGNVMRAARVRENISREDLAGKAGVSVDTLGRVEAGIPVGINSLIGIANANGYDVALIPTSSFQETIILKRTKDPE